MSEPLAPPRDADEAAAFERDGRKLEYVHFWGHGREPDGRVGRGCLSQWWPGEFAEDGHRFASAEHYMMAHKAWLFDDAETAERILAAPHPAEAQKLGRQVRRFDQATWEAERFGIVERGNVLKFGRDRDLRGYLLATSGRVLVEASPRDRVWGIGLAADDPRAAFPSAWRGLNLLGFALMAARDRLQS
jgi:ribA/ribD-fused uncharacterized protein